MFFIIATILIAFSFNINSTLYAFEGFELKANPQSYEAFVDWKSINNIILDKQGVIELLKDCRMVQKKTRLKDLTKNPVADLDECGCRNTRVRNPGVRQWAENEVINLIAQKYPDKTKQLTYTSTGSGKLFQDLIMLSRIINEGYQQIRYILVDDSFQTLIRAVKNSNISSLDLMSSYPENHPMRLFGADSRLAQLNDRFVEFVRYFENIRGTCNLQILIYGKNQTLCDSYVADCQLNPQLKADMVVGIDIEEGQSYQKLDTALNGMIKDQGTFFLYMQSGRVVRDDSSRKNALAIPGWWQLIEHELLKILGTETFMQWLVDPCIEHDD